MSQLRDFVNGRGGVVSPRDAAEFFEVAVARVREWCYANDVAMVGNTYALQLDDVEALSEALDDDTEEDVEEEEEEVEEEELVEEEEDGDDEDE